VLYDTYSLLLGFHSILFERLIVYTHTPPTYCMLLIIGLLCLGFGITVITIDAISAHMYDVSDAIYVHIGGSSSRSAAAAKRRKSVVQPPLSTTYCQ
jgi:hypothetical protein